MIQRELNLLNLLSKKSHFLFGARGTGKSFLISQQLKQKAEIISLLDSDLYLQLQQQPGKLQKIIQASDHDWVVIDEIQRIPELLNQVHLLLQNDSASKKLRFLLTGSSARKLKKENANMLGGRARKAALFPLTIKELLNEDIFDLDKYLLSGGLPAVYLSSEPYQDLRDYIETYLVDEIKTEAGVRNLPAFSRFLRVAGLCNGQQINFVKVGNDTQVHANTIREYFQIIEDTLLGFMVLPWKEGNKRKSVATSKFYFADCGLANAVSEIKQIAQDTERFGALLEQAVAKEIVAYLKYSGLSDDLTYWRTSTGIEVDFVVGSHTAIEVKSSQNSTKRDHKNLKKISEEGDFKNLIVVSRVPKAMVVEGVHHLPLEVFVQMLWDKKFF